MHLFEKSKIDLEGKDVVVLGRSDIVGKPIARLLTKANANVTVVHSKTPLDKLKNYLGDADIVVAAIGQPQFVKGEWLKDGVVVIDVGTNFIPDASKNLVNVWLVMLILNQLKPKPVSSLQFQVVLVQ